MTCERRLSTFSSWGQFSPPEGIESGVRSCTAGTSHMEHSLAHRRSQLKNVLTGSILLPTQHESLLFEYFWHWFSLSTSPQQSSYSTAYLSTSSCQMTCPSQKLRRSKQSATATSLRLRVWEAVTESSWKENQRMVSTQKGRCPLLKVPMGMRGGSTQSAMTLQLALCKDHRGLSWLAWGVSCADYVRDIRCQLLSKFSVFWMYVSKYVNIFDCYTPSDCVARLLDWLAWSVCSWTQTYIPFLHDIFVFPLSDFWKRCVKHCEKTIPLLSTRTE